MGDSSEETKIGQDRKEKHPAQQAQDVRSCPPDERALTLRESAGDHHSPPDRERTDVAPCDVAIELDTSAAIDRA
jgi:hypothetical protein